MDRFPIAALLLAAASACTPAPATVDQEAAYAFAACGVTLTGPYAAEPVRSLHVPMRDGVRLALDVVLPGGLEPGERVPTILVMTRYWRATEGAAATPFQEFYAGHGYAVVQGDVRGTGASFGVWPHHRSRAETADFTDVMDWIVAQPWSDGTVGGWGTSYTANTADWMPERNHPALKAVVSRFPDFDPYVDLYFPGGVPNAYMGSNWGLRVKRLDLNEKREVAGALVGVRPVDGDVDGRLLAEAVAARRDVPSVWESFRVLTYKDEPMPLWDGASMDSWGIHGRTADVERSGVAIQSWGSWVDAGTAQGVLRRFMTLSNPQRAVIAAWSHGARQDADPFAPADVPVDPTAAVQRLEDLCFFETHLRGRGGEEEARPLHELVYRTMGEDGWKRTTEWPVPGTVMEPWHLDAGGRLARGGEAEAGEDAYRVDFTHTTGTRNRWATNNGAGDVVYDERTPADAGLLVYTSAPLERDLEVTGHPVVRLHMASTHPDGAVFAYLEDVAPDGSVTYVAEGQLRLLHRAVSAEEPPYVVHGPWHSYARADARPMEPGAFTEVAFEMLPTSALFRAGHRIRLALGGGDADTFARIPQEGVPEWQVGRGAPRPSRVELPVVPR